MSEEKRIYPEGIRTFNRRDNAPSWIKGSCVLDPNAFFKWLKGNGAEYIKPYQDTKQIRFDFIETKDGRITLAVDTYKPKEKDPEEVSVSKADDLPF